MPILEIKNLEVSYYKEKILEDVSFSLDRGDTLAVIGPNGSGKTSLFRAVLGSLPFNGEIIKEKGIRIGYVPQKVDLERDIPITVKEFLTQNSKITMKFCLLVNLLMIKTKNLFFLK